MKKLLLAALVLGVVGGNAHAKTFDKDYVGEMETYRAHYEDTLVHLARENELGFVEIRAANPELDPWMPGEGARVTLPKQHLLPNAPRSGIVINLPEMRLYFYETPGAPPTTYPLGVGREGLNTPTGTTSIVRKKVGPTWTPTERMRKEDPKLKPFYPPGPENPMGTHAMYLGWPTYAIHGTDKPYSIGRRASSGCIRMYPDAIKEIFPRVKDGTKVTVVDQPIKVGWIGEKMYIEVHPTQEQNLRIEDIGSLSSYEITRDDIRQINKKAGELKDHIDWEAVREAVRAHTGVPTPVLDAQSMPAPHRTEAPAKATLQNVSTQEGDHVIAEKVVVIQTEEQSRAPRTRLRNLND